MRKLLKKTVVLLMAVVLLIGVMAGCGGNQKAETSKTAETSKQASASAATQNQEIKLIFYVLANKAFEQGTLDTQAELNKMLKKELNTTIEFNMTTWADEGKKYPLLLASGETIDLMAVNSSFVQEAQKGGFAELDELLPKNAPTIYGAIAKGEWDNTRINGKLFGVALPPVANRNGYVWREDLRKKYNTPEIKTYADLEKFMDAVAKNEKGMTAYAGMENSVDYLNWSLFSQKGYMLRIANAYERNTYMAFKFADPKPEAKFIYDIPEAKDIFKTIKGYADKGYWSKNAFSDKTATMEQFKNGKAAVAFVNVINANAMAAEFKSKNITMDFGWMPMYEKELAPVAKVSAALPKSGKNQAKTLMVLDKLAMDPKYHDISFNGVPDKHFKLNAEGKVQVLPEAATFEEGSFSAWKNGKLLRSIEGGLPIYEQTLKSADKWGVAVNKLNTFKVNTESIKSELAAIADVNKQYLIPLFFGMVDVESGMKIYEEKLKAAGSEKVKAEVQKQWLEYNK